MDDDTYSTKGAVCPYCGHQHHASDGNYELYDENISEWLCHSCDREFGVRVYVRYSWETEKAYDDQ